MFIRRKATFLFMIILINLDIAAFGYEAAAICAHKECPSYSVVYSNKEFEIRSYEAAQWLSTPNISADSYAEAAYQGSLILFGYFRGNNRQHVEIGLQTTSVLADVDNSTYTVYFSLPTKYQKVAPPPPSSDQIKAEKLPKYKYAAVRSRGGIDEEKILEEVAALKKSLRGTPYERAAALDRFTVAGYNSPFDFINRVDEIFLWFD